MIRALQQDWPSKNEAFSCDFTPLRAAVQNAFEKKIHDRNIRVKYFKMHQFYTICQIHVFYAS